MKNQKPQTAAEAFAKQAADMRMYLNVLTAWLDDIAPKPEDANWADVGDINKVVSQLEDIHEFLGRERN